MAVSPSVSRWEVAPADEIDFGMWSEKRVREYRGSLQQKKDLPLAVLRIERLKLRVPIFEGVDDLTLNRGLGWIPGTAHPGGAGNVGVAGHRDGFLRVLKDISLGDTVELSTEQGSFTYAVDEVEIVTPDDISVLKPRGGPALTLVTCYPFYFLGHAPQRFIVHAALQQGRTGSIQFSNKEK